MGVDAMMYVEVKEPIPDDELRRLSARLTEAFWADSFLLVRPDQADSYMPERHALRQNTRNPMRIEVSLTDRYYGPGYERGPLWLYIAIGRWLQANIPACEVWYGGDSDEDYVPLSVVETEYWDLFCQVGHRPYVGIFNQGEWAPTCGFCHVPMDTNDRGPGNTRTWTCPSCDLELQGTQEKQEVVKGSRT